MILLDTHTLIWWYERDSRLSNHAATAIELGQGYDASIVTADREMQGYPNIATIW